ncbi:hypothetical protein EVAR_19446_1 [Eumeta japonica]|uniref:Uncharacterized protein n=1 Tax=Eumeta variegata TaxID=151549 RepID=A0A4C1TRQ0_EUMVA|nr:hypothetical protein EVAR_19446_1 [Eumeta japonica]
MTERTNARPAPGQGGRNERRTGILQKSTPPKPPAGGAPCVTKREMGIRSPVSSEDSDGERQNEAVEQRFVCQHSDCDLKKFRLSETIGSAVLLGSGRE